MNSPIETTLSAIERHGCKLSRDGDGWRTSCPSPMHAHGNQKNPALSISEGSDGAVLMKCHAGCDVGEIVGAVGLELKDLFPPKEYKPTHKPERSLPVRTSPPDGVDGVSRFTYSDADKHSVIYVTRQDTADGKRIRQWGRGPDGKGWMPSLKHAPKPRPLYRLPAILKGGGTVCIHEGEKAAVAACKARLLGIHTTTIGGAGNAKHSDFSPLNGRDVCIIPDNDEPGEKHAQQVAKLATDAGAKSVKIVRLPGLPAKGDVVEWLADGGTDEQWQKLIAKTAPETENKPNESMDGAVDRLAKLSLLDYDTVRQDEAKALGVRATTLDAAVEDKRKAAEQQGSMFTDVEPWPDEINGGELLNEIVAVIQRYMVMSNSATEAAALWVLNTYVHDASYHSPILLITSPEKRCGKSTLLSLLYAMCARALNRPGFIGGVFV